jgi:hypothetical protein
MKSQQQIDSETEAKKRAETAARQRREEVESMEMAEKTHTHFWKKLSMEEVILSILIILSVIGAGVSQVSVSAGGTYWLAMVPIIAAATVYIEWVKVKDNGVRWQTLLRRQLYPWGSLIISIELVSMLSYFGRITNEAVSLVTLLLVAQVTFLIGVYVDWRFSVVALFQIFCVVILAYLATYIWVVLIVAIGIIALGIYFHRKLPGEGLSLRR